mgnify:CR=1 FL=1
MNNKQETNFFERFNIKDWITVIISISAVTISFNSYRYQVNVNAKNQINQSNKELKSQAINVSMWYQTVSSKSNENITISNSSENAIYDIFVINVSNRSSGTPADLNLVHKYGNDYSTFCQYFEVLPPGRTELYLPPMNAAGGEHSVPEIFFKDSNGVTWFRNYKGNLSKTQNIATLLQKYEIPLPLNQYSRP